VYLFRKFSIKQYRAEYTERSSTSKAFSCGVACASIIVSSTYDWKVNPQRGASSYLQQAVRAAVGRRGEHTITVVGMVYAHIHKRGGMSESKDRPRNTICNHKRKWNRGQELKMQGGPTMDGPRGQQAAL